MFSSFQMWRLSGVENWDFWISNDFYNLHNLCKGYFSTWKSLFLHITARIGSKWPFMWVPCGLVFCSNYISVSNWFQRFGHRDCLIRRLCNAGHAWNNIAEKIISLTSTARLGQCNSNSSSRSISANDAKQTNGLQEWNFWRVKYRQLNILPSRRAPDMVQRQKKTPCHYSNKYYSINFESTQYYH